ncbi:MAG: hypothetical protein ACTSUE_05580 [Promethearchaeota archaeon]
MKEIKISYFLLDDLDFLSNSQSLETLSISTSHTFDLTHLKELKNLEKFVFGQKSHLKIEGNIFPSSLKLINFTFNAHYLNLSKIYLPIPSGEPTDPENIYLFSSLLDEGFRWEYKYKYILSREPSKLKYN